MGEMIEALRDFFAANLSIWELLGFAASGTFVLLYFRKRETKWTPYTIYWAIFPIYITIIRRWLGGGHMEIHHDRLASDILNVAMTLPYGLAAYLAICKKIFKISGDPERFKDQTAIMSIKAILLTTTSGFCLSGFIETMQTITKCGQGEWLDIMTNTSGALIGAVLGLCWSKFIQKKEVRQ